MKYSSDKILTLQNFMEGPIVLFNTLGLIILNFEEDARKNTWLERLHITLFLVEISWNIACMIAHIFLKQFETTIQITIVILYSTFAMSSIVKGAWIYFQRYKIRKLFCLIVQNFPRTQEDRRLYQLDDYYMKIRKYNKFLITFHLMTTSIFNIFPLVQSISEYFLVDEGDFPYYLPYLMSYPFDERKLWGYLTAYLTQCMGAYSCSCLFLGTDLLTLNLLHVMNMNLDFLRRKLLHFKPKGSDNDIEELRQFLILHQKLFIYNEKMENVLGVTNFANYCACVIMLCLVSVQIVMGSEFWNIFKFIFFLLSTLAQLFFISIFATAMQYMSTGIGDALFQQPWYCTNMKYQRMLKFSLTRSQQPMILTGLGFFTISMESFKTLMSTSYQFFTLIKRLEDGA